MSDQSVFLYIGVYSNPVFAREDLEIVRDLHAAKIIGTYDAAVATKEADGTVTVSKWEKPTQHGAWTGVAVGAVVGILFRRRSRNHRQRAQAGREGCRARGPWGTPRAAAGRRPSLSGKARS